MCVHSQFLSRVLLCVTPWTVAHWALLSVGFSKQEYWSGLPCPPPGDLSDLGIEPASPALQVDSLPLSPQRSLREGEGGTNEKVALTRIYHCV